MEKTERLSLSYIMPNQAMKHVPVNESLRLIDQILHISVKSMTIESEPTNPQNSSAYIVPSTHTGDNWAGANVNDVAIYVDDAWHFIAPPKGFLIFDEEENNHKYFDGVNWVALSQATAGEITKFAVNSTKDDYNRLIVKSDAVLFTNDDVTPGSGDHRFNLNKTEINKILSFNFQSSYQTKFEFGLLGNDDFTFKTSENNSDFFEVFSIKAGKQDVNFSDNINIKRVNENPLGTRINLLDNANFLVSTFTLPKTLVNTKNLMLDRWIIDAKSGSISADIVSDNNIIARKYLDLTFNSISTDQALEQKIYFNDIIDSEYLALQFKAKANNLSVKSIELYAYAGSVQTFAASFYDPETGTNITVTNEFQNFNLNLYLSQDNLAAINNADYLVFKITFQANQNGANFSIANLQLEKGSNHSLINIIDPNYERLYLEKFLRVEKLYLSSTKQIIRHNMLSSPTVTGGGFGFLASNLDDNHIEVSQSSSSLQELVLISENLS